MAKAKIGRELAGSGKLRMIPVLGIIPQPTLDRTLSARLVPPGKFSTGETERSRDQPAVKSSRAESDCRVRGLFQGVRALTTFVGTRN